MKHYRFPNIKTVEAVLSAGDTYRGYFNGKHFSIGLSFSGLYTGKIGDRVMVNDTLYLIMADVYNALGGSY